MADKTGKKRWLCAALFVLIPLVAWAGCFDGNNFRFDGCMYSTKLTQQYNAQGGTGASVYMCVRERR